MTIVPSEPTAAAVERPNSSALQPSTKLQQFARDAQAVYAIAQSLAPTPFVPTSYKKRGERWLETTEVAQTVAAAILAGDEIGLSPMQALQGLDVIEGRPALSALAQRALVQAHGHEVWVHDRVQDGRGQGTRVSVTVRGRRAGSEHIAESTWSIDRARQAGLLGKKNWQNHPEAMCFARASADVCRQIAADVLMGLSYSTEELQDEETLAAAGAGDHSVSVRPKEQTQAEIAGQGTAEAKEPAVEPAPERAQDEPEESSQADTAEEGGDEEPKCGFPKPEEPTKICSRPFEHSGRHFYGDTITEEEAAARAAAAPEPEPIKDPETTDPALAAGLEDPERCEATNPETGDRCTGKRGHPGPHVLPAKEEATLPLGEPAPCPYHWGGFQCKREARHEGLHRADTPEGAMEWGEGAELPDAEPESGDVVDGELAGRRGLRMSTAELLVEEGFAEPTDEELEAALEADRAAQVEREAATQVVAEPAQPAPTAGSTDSEALPIEDPDDPWADFS
jgi:hypothetical protein